MKEQAYEDYRIYTESNRVYHEAQETLGRAVKGYTSTQDKPRIQAMEIGCGFGDTTLQILRADPRVHLLIAEIDYEMLQATEKRLQAEGISPDTYKFSLGDALGTIILFRGCDFDIVASAQTIHNFPNQGNGSKKECYEGIEKILAPGGLFVNADKYVSGNPDQYRLGLARRMAEFAEYAFKHRDEKQAREAITRWYEHLLHDIDPERIMHLGIAKRQLEELGFSDIKTVWSKELEVVLTALKGGK